MFFVISKIRENPLYSTGSYNWFTLVLLSFLWFGGYFKELCDKSLKTDLTDLCCCLWSDGWRSSAKALSPNLRLRCRWGHKVRTERWISNVERAKLRSLWSTGLLLNPRFYSVSIWDRDRCGFGDIVFKHFNHYRKLASVPGTFPGIWQHLRPGGVSFLMVSFKKSCI